MKEKIIPGFEKAYKVSSDGYVISYHKSPPAPIVTHMQNNRLYVFLYNSIEKKYQRKMLARLVTDAFVPNPNPKKFSHIRYANGDYADCSSSNLVWVMYRKCNSCPEFRAKCTVSGECYLVQSNKKKVTKQKKLATQIAVINAIREIGGVERLKLSCQLIAYQLINGNDVTTIANKIGCSSQYVYRVRKKILNKDTSILRK